MPAIVPFRALRYDPEVAGELRDLVAPPFDVITPAQREALEARNAANVVRLTLPRDAGGGDSPARYEHAHALIDSWIESGVLRVDDRDSLTIYEQRYTLDRTRRTVRGVLAAVTLDEGEVLPHERTYAHTVTDRLSLMRATSVNLEPIFLVYEGETSDAHDAMEAACAVEPFARFDTDDGTEHIVWRVDQPAVIASIITAIEKATVVIADGHHRWRTAQEYRDERRARDGSGPWDYHLSLLVDVARSGAALLPIHRVLPEAKAEDVLRALDRAFTVEQTHGHPDELASSLERARGDGGRSFVMLDATRAWRLTVSDPDAERSALPPGRSEHWNDLDVAVLHSLVFDRLLGGSEARYVHSPGEAADAVVGGGVAFLLAAAPFASVRAVAEAGDAMPQKSTYFVPKPKTGLVLRPL